MAGRALLRAESVFTAATYLEELDLQEHGRRVHDAYGGASLHEQSHGEAFLAVMLNRFGPNGLYLLDEPEAALSYEDAEPVRLTQSFLSARGRFLEQLLAD